jgi:hypothetical protein
VPTRGALRRDQNPGLTCLWCGKKLKQHTEMDVSATDEPRWTLPDPYAVGEEAYQNAARAREAQHRAWLKAHTHGTGEYGYYRDNAFCSLGCAWAFGLAAARAGYRLVGRKED